MKKLILWGLCFAVTSVYGEPIPPSPVGDGVHTDLFEVLGQAFVLQEKSNPPRSPDAMKAFLEGEREALAQRDLKPYGADVVERELSHLLGILCDQQASCRQLGFYDTDGVAFALTEPKTKDCLLSQEIPGVLDKGLRDQLSVRPLEPIVHESTCDQRPVTSVASGVCQDDRGVVGFCQSLPGKILGYVVYLVKQ